MRIHQQEMELFLLALPVDGAEQHPAALNAHHGPGRQIGDGNAGLARRFLRLAEGAVAGGDRDIRISD